MNINPKIKNAAFLAGGMLLAVSLLQAFNPQPDPPAFAAIGMTAAETARLNVVCYDPRCSVRLSFTDADGAVITSLTRDLTRGTSTWLSLPAVQLPAGHDWRDGGSRIMLLPAVQVNGRVAAAVEVFDSLTGVSSSYTHAGVPQGLMGLIAKPAI